MPEACLVLLGTINQHSTPSQVVGGQVFLFLIILRNCLLVFNNDVNDRINQMMALSKVVKDILIYATMSSLAFTDTLNGLVCQAEQDF
jgi:hypothetical protein